MRRQHSDPLAFHTQIWLTSSTSTILAFSTTGGHLGRVISNGNA